MTRVLFPFVGDSVGGSHLSSLELIRRLPAFGYEPVIGVHARGVFADYLEAHGFGYVVLPIVEFPQARNPFHQVRQMLACARVLRRPLADNRIAIVHTNDRRMHLAWTLAARMARVRHVWHERTNVVSRRVGWFSRSAHVVVTISDYVRESAPRALARRAYVVANPVTASLGKSVPSAQRFEGCREAREKGLPLVVWVGNWSPQKRPRVFAEIARDLAERLPAGVRFLMVGKSSEPERSDIQAMLAEHGLTERFTIREFETPIDPIIASADVLVATAIREGLGRTVIEAMQLGTAVVASADGGHREVISDGVDGDLVAPDDVAGFVRRIERLLVDSELRERYCANAREMAIRRFSPDSHARAIATIYDRLAATEGASIPERNPR